jgi:putative FmdB family regulatory protein
MIRARRKRWVRWGGIAKPFSKAVTRRRTPKSSFSQHARPFSKPPTSALAIANGLAQNSGVSCMPTYEYVCPKCGHEFELFQSMRDEPLKKCPKCKKAGVKRLIGGGAGLIQGQRFLYHRL